MINSIEIPESEALVRELDRRGFNLQQWEENNRILRNTLLDFQFDLFSTEKVLVVETEDRKFCNIELVSGVNTLVLHGNGTVLQNGKEIVSAFDIKRAMQDFVNALNRHRK